MSNYVFAEVNEDLYEDFTPETAGSAGIDLRADIDSPFKLSPGEFKLIPTGVKLALPNGYEAQVRPRSGLSYRHGLTVLNSPGTIDSDYRDDIGVILIHFGDQPIVIEPGMRIAQLVITRHETTSIAWRYVGNVAQAAPSERGTDGFGSTGTT